MNLYYLSQTRNRGYDTYDSAVVAAETEEEAGNIEVGSKDTWAPPRYVEVELIGTAVPGTKAGIICASFNAG